MIDNITPEGCCISLNGAQMSPGQHVLLRLESDEALLGIVCWVRDDQAGLMFEEILEKKRVDYLRREHSTFLSDVEWSKEMTQRSVI